MNDENTTDENASYESKGTTTAQLTQELLTIKLIHELTGKIDADTLQMLLQTALIADVLVRQTEAKAKEDEKQAKAHEKLLVDLQTESFAKDIQIASLQAQLDNRTL